MQENPFPDELTFIVEVLESTPDFPRDQAALKALAQDIAPYVRRTQLPRQDAVIQIATNYLQDGLRVKRLLEDPDYNGWQDVLQAVINVARKSRLYPDDVDAGNWPDLEGFEDIRKNLHQYNFEGSFASWLTAVTVHRLHRFWRDQNAIFRGGAGFQNRGERDQDTAAGRLRQGPYATQQSLDLIFETNRSAQEILEDPSLSVESVAEAAECFRLVKEVIDELAEATDDPRLFEIWRLVLIEEQTLSDVAQRFGVAISTIHRQLKQIKNHVRQDPRLLNWRDPDSS